VKNILICLAAAFLVSPAFASVYKWQDASGRTHYEDISPTEDVVKVNAKMRSSEQIAKGEINQSPDIAKRSKVEATRDPVDPSEQQIRDGQ